MAPRWLTRKGEQKWRALRRKLWGLGAQGRAGMPAVGGREWGRGVDDRPAAFSDRGSSVLGSARVPVRLLSSALVTKPIHAPVAVAVADELARPVMYPTCAHNTSTHAVGRRRV